MIGWLLATSLLFVIQLPIKGGETTTSTVISGPTSTVPDFFANVVQKPPRQATRVDGPERAATCKNHPQSYAIWKLRACGAYRWSAPSERAIGRLWSAPAAWLHANRSATSPRARSVTIDWFPKHKIKRRFEQWSFAYAIMKRRGIKVSHVIAVYCWVITWIYVITWQTITFFLWVLYCTHGCGRSIKSGN